VKDRHRAGSIEIAYKRGQADDATACIFAPKPLDSAAEERTRMASVLKKRRKKMRKHKYKKLRRRQKFLRRKS
jgi:hypothetical protein